MLKGNRYVLLSLMMVRYHCISLSGKKESGVAISRFAKILLKGGNIRNPLRFVKSEIAPTFPFVRNF